MSNINAQDQAQCYPTCKLSSQKFDNQDCHKLKQIDWRIWDQWKWDIIKRHGTCGIVTSSSTASSSVSARLGEAAGECLILLASNSCDLFSLLIATQRAITIILESIFSGFWFNICSITWLSQTQNAWYLQLYYIFEILLVRGKQKRLIAIIWYALFFFPRVILLWLYREPKPIKPRRPQAAPHHRPQTPSTESPNPKNPK